MKWLRAIIGPQPILRVIAVLLAVIAVILVLIWREAVTIEKQIIEPCGNGEYTPCYVKTANP